MPLLFGTSGIRGDAETLFTDQFCFDIGRVFVEFLKRHKSFGPLAIGLDPRPSSPRIKEALLKGLITSGEELFDEGICPIPAINWLLKAASVNASVMVSGSHIASHLNGVKFYAFEEEITKEHEQEIERLYDNLKNKQKPGSEKPEVRLESRAQELYTEMLTKLIRQPLPKWKIVVDCANGAQSVAMPDILLNRLGLQVVRVNCDPQQEFIARDTDTDDKAGLEELKRVVVKEKADLGIAYDGDGDRVVFVDEQGRFVQGEYSCSLVAKYSETPVVVTPISSSQVVETIGKKVIRTKVGSPYVIAAMKKAGAIFGFEPNGGAISGEIMYTRDGGSMTMKLLNLFSQFDGSFSEFIGQLPRFYMVRTKVDCPWELNEVILQEAKKNLRGIKVEEVDGLKIWTTPSSWILFRSSSNAPEFRVFAEAKDEGEATELGQEGIKFVKEIIKKAKK